MICVKSSGTPFFFLATNQTSLNSCGSIKTSTYFFLLGDVAAASDGFFFRRGMGACILGDSGTDWSFGFDFLGAFAFGFDFAFPDLFVDLTPGM